MARQGKLALWQVMARVIDQGSRLSAVRLAERHGVCGIVGLDTFNYEGIRYIFRRNPQRAEEIATNRRDKDFKENGKSPLSFYL